MWSTVSNMSSMITLSFRLVHCSDFVTNRYTESRKIMGPGARFSKVPIINGPGKLLPFTVKIEVSIVLHLT